MDKTGGFFLVIIFAMVLIWVAVNPNLTDMLASKNIDKENIDKENENNVTVDPETNAITINGHTIERSASGHPVKNPGGKKNKNGIGSAIESVKNKMLYVVK